MLAALDPRRVSSALRRLVPDQRGNAAIIAAISFPLLLGAAGLAVDTIQWVLQKRQIQAATDTAAISAVYGLIGSQDMENAVNGSLVRSKSIPANASIQAVQSPPGHEADPFAVAVRVAVPAKITFTSMFMRRVPVITAEATATVVENGEYCAFALGSMDDPGVVVRANSTVKMECGVATNSSSPKALQAEGSSNMQAPTIVARGGIDSGGAIQDSHVRAYGLSQKDPLEDTEPPLVPNSGCPNVTVNPDAASQPSGEIAINPGCYGNMTLNGNVRLQSGEYILNQGNFVVGPQGHVSCDACTIFLTSTTAEEDGGSIGKVRIAKEATVNLNATREGPNAGILFYQDRHTTRDLPGEENRIGGSSFSSLGGLLYFPSDTLYIDGSQSPDLQCTRLIARRLIFEGRVYIGKRCDGLDRMMFRGTEVHLVS